MDKNVVDPHELSNYRVRDYKEPITDRPFSKEDVRWSMAQVKRISNALIIHGD